MSDFQEKAARAKRLFEEYTGLTEAIDYLEFSGSPISYLETLNSIKKDILIEYNELYLVLKMSAMLNRTDFDFYELPNLLARDNSNRVDMQ